MVVRQLINYSGGWLERGINWQKKFVLQLTPKSKEVFFHVETADLWASKFDSDSDMPQFWSWSSELVISCIIFPTKSFKLMPQQIVWWLKKLTQTFFIMRNTSNLTRKNEQDKTSTLSWYENENSNDKTQLHLVLCIFLKLVLQFYFTFQGKIILCLS